MKLCRNTVTVIAILAACVVGSLSVITNHDQLELTLGVIAALAGLSHVPRKSDTPNTEANPG